VRVSTSVVVFIRLLCICVNAYNAIQIRKNWCNVVHRMNMNEHLAQISSRLFHVCCRLLFYRIKLRKNWDCIALSVIKKFSRYFLRKKIFSSSQKFATSFNVDCFDQALTYSLSKTHDQVVPQQFVLFVDTHNQKVNEINFDKMHKDLIHWYRLAPCVSHVNKPPRQIRHD
jgi:hypothetical protein